MAGTRWLRDAARRFRFGSSGRTWGATAILWAALFTIAAVETEMTSRRHPNPDRSVASRTALRPASVDGLGRKLLDASIPFADVDDVLKLADESIESLMKLDVVVPVKEARASTDSRTF